MRLSFVSSAILSLAGFSFAVENSCDDGPFAPSVVAGEAFPTPFDYQVNCETRYASGEVVVGIEAWAARWQLKAVRFKYSQSGWGPVRGTIPEKKDETMYDQKEWDGNEPVKIQLWNNAPDDKKPVDAVGRIKITKGGQAFFEVGAQKVAKDEIRISDSEGVLLGARTRSGLWLSSIEFKLLKGKVISAEVTDMTVTENMDDWNKKQPNADTLKGVEQVNLATVFFINQNQVGGPNLTYTFTNTDSRSITKTLTSEKTNQWALGIKVTVSGKVGIPFLAEGSVSVEGSFAYTRTEMRSDSTEWKDNKDLSILLGSPGTSNHLPPQRAARCESWAVKGSFDSPYTATIQATLDDGTKYAYNDAGRATSVSWFKSSTACKEIGINEIPQGSKIQSAGDSSAPSSIRAVKFRG